MVFHKKSNIPSYKRHFKMLKQITRKEIEWKLLTDCLSIFLRTGTTFGLFHSDGNFPFLKHYLKIILSVLQIKGPHIFNMRILFMSCLLVLFSCGLSIKISWLEKFIRDSKSLGLFVITSGSLFGVLIKKNCVEKELKKFSFVFQINNKFIFMIKMLDTWCFFIV